MTTPFRRGFKFGLDGKIEYAYPIHEPWEDDLPAAPNRFYSKKSIASQKRNEWLPQGLEAARKEKARINKEKMRCNRITRRLLKIQRRLETYGAPKTN